MPWLLDDSAQLTPARLGNSQRQNREAISQVSGGCVAAGVGTIVAVVYRRIVPRLGPAQAIGAITHRLWRLIWKILHKHVRYDERGPAVSTEAKKVRARKLIRERTVPQAQHRPTSRRMASRSRAASAAIARAFKVEFARG
jgi:hypothetical protein